MKGEKRPSEGSKSVILSELQDSAYEPHDSCLKQVSPWSVGELLMSARVGW